jgi:protein-L-isoaspartate(D-aspartate) O-methyltransferase
MRGNAIRRRAGVGNRTSARWLAVLLVLAGAGGCRDRREPEHARDGMAEMNVQRDRMLRFDLEGRGIRDPAVLEAMRRVPRHEFVPAEFRAEAYADHPLPIGRDQTISQPYIVAAMTELAAVPPGGTVLEVGTGSGYQAAVLSLLARRVYTIEILPELGNAAAARLERLGYGNVETRVGDGYLGWPEQAPFDAILVTAGAEHVPQPLVDQLRPGGRMVLPVGPTEGIQELRVLVKQADGTIRSRSVMSVRFVPLTGDRGSSR